MTPDAQTLLWLATLWRGGSWGAVWRKDNKLTHWTQTIHIDLGEGARDVYIGVHPLRARRGAHERGRLVDVEAVNCFFAEYDAKDYGGLEAIRAHIARLPVQPQVIVASGGGYHCYWFFKESIPVTESARDYLCGVQRAWVRWAGGDPAASDLARVLRLPNTLNCKYDPPRRVQFERFGLTPEGNELYDAAELCAIAEAHWDGAEAMPEASATENVELAQLLSGRRCWLTANAREYPCDARGQPLKDWHTDAALLTHADAAARIGGAVRYAGLRMDAAPELAVCEFSNCLNAAGGCIDPVAATICGNWPSYTEITPEARGLRIWWRVQPSADTPLTVQTHHATMLHVYSNGLLKPQSLIFGRGLHHRALRFVAVTGQAYRWDDSPQHMLATITPDALARIAQMLKAKAQDEKAMVQKRGEQKREEAIDVYNRTMDIRELMAYYGYTIQGDRFTRPGKDPREGTSGTIDVARNRAYTFSSNDPAYDPNNTSPSGMGCTLRPFDLLCRIDFKGDAKAAVKHLHSSYKRKNRRKKGVKR